jgi:hypothetical protein
MFQSDINISQSDINNSNLDRQNYEKRTKSKNMPLIWILNYFQLPCITISHNSQQVIFI